MKPNQLASEAWDEIKRTYAVTDVTGSKEAKDGTAIIQAVIEKATKEVREANDNLFKVARKHSVENTKLRATHASDIHPRWHCSGCGEPHIPKHLQECPVCRLAKPAAHASVIGIEPRITIGGHDYMLVSEHYAKLNEATEKAKQDWTKQLATELVDEVHQSRSHASVEPTPEQMRQLHEAASEARRRVSKMSRSERKELEDAARRKIHGEAHASEQGHTITEIHEKIQSGMAAARLTPEYEQEGRELERGHTIHASEHGVVISQNEAALADRIVNMIHVKDESLTLKERIAILIAEHREQGAEQRLENIRAILNLYFGHEHGMSAEIAMEKIAALSQRPTPATEGKK